MEKQCVRVAASDSSSRDTYVGKSGTASDDGFSTRAIWQRTHLAMSHDTAKHETNTRTHASPALEDMVKSR